MFKNKSILFCSVFLFTFFALLSCFFVAGDDSYTCKKDILNRPLPHIEIQDLLNNNAQEPIHIENIDEYKQLEDNSSELLSHHILDAFVDDMNRNPLVLAAYVYNEIGLIDGIGLPDTNDNVIVPGKINRSAIGTFLEKQGSPWEICALLVYLLRKAGYAATYVEGDIEISKSQMSKALQMQLNHNCNDDTSSIANIITGNTIALNYPWVVYYNENENRWMHLFPWIKNTHIVEGKDLYTFMPDEFNTSKKWIRKYLESDNRITKHIGHDNNDTAAVLFERFVKEKLFKKRLSIDDVGVRYINKKKSFSSFEDFPTPFSFEPKKVTKNLSDRNDLFTKIKIKIYSQENPSKNITTEMQTAQLHNRAMYVSFKAKDNSPRSHTMSLNIAPFDYNNKEEWDHLCLELDSSDKNIKIKVTYDQCINQKTNHWNNFPGITIEPSKEHEMNIRKGEIAAICTNFGRVTIPMLDLHFKELDATKHNKGTMLYLVGMSYYKDFCKGREILRNLHKINNATPFSIGLSKLSFKADIPLVGNPNLEYPQVDMYNFEVKAFGNKGIKTTDKNEKITSSFLNFFYLLLVDASSNEHHTLNTFYDDKDAVSTVKLLQLAHERHKLSGGKGSGFLQFEADNIEQFKKDIGFKKILQDAGDQWETICKTINDKDSFAFMTPEIISSSPNGNESFYQGTGALIFTPEQTYSLISTNKNSINGGVSAPIPNEDKQKILKRSDGSLQLDRNNINKQSSQQTEEKQKKDLATTMHDTSKWQYIADPVDIATGNFYIDHTDMSLGGPLPLEIKRNYNSKNQVKGHFGYGWKHNIVPYLVVNDDTILASEMNGTVITYSKNNHNTWTVSPKHNPDLITTLNNNKFLNKIGYHNETYVIHGYDGSKRKYQVKNGQTTNPQLVLWKDQYGNCLTFEYEEKTTFIRQIKSGNGSFLGFRYNSEGLISQIYSSDGRQVFYKYDDFDDLVEITLPDESKICYEYEKKTKDNKTFSTHRIIKETKPNGQILENKYDNGGRIVEQKATVGNGLEPILNARFAYFEKNNIKRHDVYDIFGNRTRYKIYKNLIFSIEDPLKNITSQKWWLGFEQKYLHDDVSLSTGDLGNYNCLISQTDKNGLTTAYKYDGKGNVISIINKGEDLNGEGSITEIPTKYYYNDKNLVTKIEAPLINTIFTYDNYLLIKIENEAEGNIISTTEIEYETVGESKGLLKAERKYDRNNNLCSETTFENDFRGFHTKRIEKTLSNDEDVITDLHYNQQGMLAKEITQNGSIHYEYDIMNRLIGTIYADKNDKKISWQFNSFNENGQIEWTQGNRYNPIDYSFNQYDAAGRIILKAVARFQANKDRLNVEAAPEEDITIFEYDGFGNLTKITDPNQNITKMEYNALGELVRKIIYDSTSNEPIFDEYYEYYKGGKKTTHTDKTTSIQEYTTGGLLKREIHPGGTTSEFIYDASGRVVRQKQRHSGYWTIEYDDKTNTITKIHEQTKIEEKKTYDINGNLTKIIDGEGHTFTKKYDGLGRIKEETDPEGKTLYHNYSNDTHTISNDFKDHITNKYDTLGRLVEKKITDDKNVLSRITKHEYCSNKHCKVTTEGDEDIISKVFTDNLDNSIIECGIKTRMQCRSVNIYEYDKKGNLIQKIDPSQNKMAFTFDGLNRQTSQTMPDNTTIKYMHLRTGLATLIPTNIWFNTTTNAFGQKGNEILQAEGDNIFSLSNFEYHKESGLLKTIQTDNYARHYTYDSLGRIETIETGNNQIREYSYDKRSLITSITEQTSDNSSQVVRAFDKCGRIIKETVYLNEEKISEIHQAWDDVGRRVSLHHDTEFGLNFSYDSANNMTEVKVDELSLNYQYGTDGILKHKTSPFATTTFTHDLGGRTTNITTNINNESELSQNLIWNENNKLSKYELNADIPFEGNSRSYLYSKRGQLLEENIKSKTNTSTFKYDFDFGESGGLGVLTKAALTQNNLNEQTWELLNNNNCIETGLKFKCEKITSENEVSDFISSYDLNQRLISHGNRKFEWNDLDLLTKVVDEDYNWQAIYDGLGRRIRTIYTPKDIEKEKITITSIYDPEVEYLEIGLKIETEKQTKTIWKIHGPDISGSYGGMQGVGGLEAIVTEDNIIGVINDYFGSIIAKADNTKGSWEITPLATSLSAYGPFFDDEFHAIETKDLPNSLLLSMRWCGRTLDPTGFIYLGARYYNPHTRRFISGDPMGHEATLDLYTYANGDPVNNFDPDGKIPVIIAVPLIYAAVGAGIGLVAQIVSDVAKGEMSSWKDYASSTAKGAIQGVVTGTSLMLSASPTLALASGSVAGNLFEQAISKDPFSVGDLAYDVGSSLAFGYAGRSLAKILSPLAKNPAGMIGKLGRKWRIFGRGGLSQVDKQIGTKIALNQINNISNDTWKKMFLFQTMHMKNTLSCFEKSVKERLSDYFFQEKFQRFLTPYEFSHDPIGKYPNKQGSVY